ncbi:hypothetical protein BDZ91DRAFT_438868 [Kalaharituber pfeilii]|nr:hypothetical protein BDZ91DRAFT_438868 [Kalaharituber pfeilii]
MWALHIPTFHWTPLPFTSPQGEDSTSLVPSPRDSPVCLLARNQYLVIIGGRPLDIQECLSPTNTRRPFRDQKTGIPNSFPYDVSTYLYNLVGNTWTDIYRADAGSYSLPKAISESLSKQFGGPGSAWVTPERPYASRQWRRVRRRFLCGREGKYE